MSIETANELKGMKRAGRITRLTLDELEANVRVGMTTAELDAVAARVFAKHGARSAPTLVYGFPGHVLLSLNDEIVHGVPGARRLMRGDLLKLDVTVECNCDVADAARTVIVGRGSDGATRLIACVRAAFRAGLAVARAGTRVNEIGRAVEGEVRRHGFTVVRGLSGHGVGRTIHEEPSVPNEYNPMQKDVLTEGLVITIEPMISAGSAEPVEDRDGWTIRTKDGSLAAHHEHTIMITRSEPVIFTAA
jgi:methionyl aminopeptidase